MIFSHLETSGNILGMLGDELHVRECKMVGLDLGMEGMWRRSDHCRFYL